MTPVVSFVGYSNSGKTTFVVKVIQELKKRGCRVALIKHDGHDFEMDHEGTDTWKHRQAGADVVCIASNHKFAMIETTPQPLPLDAIIAKIDQVDLILTEGFKQEQKPQIEVNRPGAICIGRKEQTIAVVADAVIYPGIVHFGFDEVSKVADLLENMIIRRML